MYGPAPAISAPSGRVRLSMHDGSPVAASSSAPVADHPLSNEANTSGARQAMNAQIQESDWLLRLLVRHDPPPIGVQRLASLSRLSSGTRLFRRGEDIIAQGCVHDGLFVLFEGFALRHRILSDGRRQALDIALPGDVVGSPGCFLGAALNTVTALTRGAVAFVPSSELTSLLADLPQLSIALIRCATGEAARLSEHLVDLGRRIQIRDRRALAALAGFDDNYLLSVRRPLRVMSVPARARPEASMPFRYGSSLHHTAS